jgi:hypothetical protein
VTVRARWKEPRVQLLGFGLLHVVIFAAVFRGPYVMPFSGTGLYYEYASAIVAGQVPYRDFLVEYPPFALVFFTLPRLLGESFRWYYVWYQVLIVVADLVVLFTLFAARDDDTTAWRTLASYTLLLLAVGPIILQQFDLFAAAFALLAIYYFSIKRDHVAWAFIGLATMTKVYPLLLAPVFLILDWQSNHSIRRLLNAALVVAMTCVVVMLPLLVIAPTSVRAMYSFHSGRGIHLDTVYASIAFAARSLGWGWVDVEFTYRSWNIAGPVADALLRFSTATLAVVLLASYALIFARARMLSDNLRRNSGLVATCAALVLAAGLIGSKVLSPQFLVWLLTPLPLIVRPRRWTIWAVFALSGAVTYYIYPRHYSELLARESGAVTALALRNLLLVSLVVLLAHSLRQFTRQSRDLRAA